LSKTDIFSEFYLWYVLTMMSDIQKKIRAGQNLSPDEMVQLMKEYRRLMSEGWTLEQINDYFDIDPDKSLII